MVMVYHATPYLFTDLRIGSWVSTSLAEACLHLLMKNTGQNFDNSLEHRLQGYVFAIPDFDPTLCDEEITLGDVVNYRTNHTLSVLENNRKSLRDAIGTLPENKQWVFYADDIVDFTAFLQQDAG